MSALPQSPVRQRIVLADALRGFALMGLYIVHMVEYFELYWYKPEPGWIHNVIFFLFGGKAYGIFALLFGLSFYIILDNYDKRGVDFRARFCWRLTLLLLFGYIHSLLYAGDILQLLALCGFLLVLTQKLSTRFIIAISAFFLLQVLQLIAIGFHQFAGSSTYESPKFIHFMGSNFDMFAHANLPSLVAYNIFDGQFGKWWFFFETGRLWNIIGLMYAGAALGRLGFFEKSQHKLSVLLVGVAGVALLFFLFQAIAPSAAGLLHEGMARWSAEQLFAYYGNLMVICGGVFLFIIAFQLAITNKLITAFAPAGRMTLTFYLAQSLVYVPVFYGFGLGAYDFIGQFWSLALGIVGWLVQMALATWWLKNHRYGPMEWVWRKLTFAGFRQN